MNLPIGVARRGRLLVLPAREEVGGARDDRSPERRRLHHRHRRDHGGPDRALTASRTEIVVITAIAVAAVVAFVVQERRSPEPMISLELWGRRPVAAVNASSLFAGMAMIGLTTFLPVFVQGVMQKPPLIAGFALSAMVLGWPIGATLSPALWSRFGVRTVLRTGAALIPVGALVFVFLRPDTSPFVAGSGRRSSASAWGFRAAPRSC